MFVSLKVASQLLHATSGPVKAVEGSLHQWSHDAAHVHLVSTAVPLTVMLHPQSSEREESKKKKKEDRRDLSGKETNQWRQTGNVWEEKKRRGTKERGSGGSLIRYYLR